MSWEEILDKVRDEHELLSEITDSGNVTALDILKFRIKLADTIRGTKGSSDEDSQLIRSVCFDYSAY